ARMGGTSLYRARARAPRPRHGAAPSSRLAALVRSRARGAGDSVDDAGGLLLPVAPDVVVRVVLHQGLDAPALRGVHEGREAGIVHRVQRVEERPAEALL